MFTWSVVSSRPFGEELVKFQHMFDISPTLVPDLGSAPLVTGLSLHVLSYDFKACL